MQIFKHTSKHTVYTAVASNKNRNPNTFELFREMKQKQLFRNQLNI